MAVSSKDETLANATKGMRRFPFRHSSSSVSEQLRIAGMCQWSRKFNSSIQLSWFPCWNWCFGSKHLKGWATNIRRVLFVTGERVGPSRRQCESCKIMSRTKRLALLDKSPFKLTAGASLQCHWSQNLSETRRTFSMDSGGEWDYI